MRTFTALAIIAAPCTAQPHTTTGDTLINDPARIERLNSEEGSLWTAAPHNKFEGMTFNDIKVLLGTRLSHISLHLNNTLPDSAYPLSADDVPSDFDSRTQWKDLIHPIRDQQQCGSCWAFSASEVLSDRVAIASGKSSPVLSAEDMVSCDKKDDGCEGGMLENAWKYLTGTGIVTDTCFPYTAGHGHAATCITKCKDSEDFSRTKAKTSYAINSEANMQQEIMKNGPIQVGFKVYSSFMSYSSGVYHKHKHEKPEGGHAVKIVGWGVDGGKKYWSVANSWNTDWGEDGFFRILRGEDECGIETMGPPYAGTAPSMSETEIVV